jgi:hypothetical protein
MNNEFFRRYIDIITEAAVPPAAPAKPVGTVQQAAAQYKGQEVSGSLNISALKALMPKVDSTKLAAAMAAIKTGKLTPAHYQTMGIAFQQLVNADAATTTKIMNVLKKVSAEPAAAPAAKPVAPVAATAPATPAATPLA